LSLLRPPPNGVPKPPGVDDGKLGDGDDGVIGAGPGFGAIIGIGAGFGAGFFATAFFAFLVFLAAFFIPFFLRAGAARFAFLDFFAFDFFRFFAMIVLPIGSTKLLATHNATAPCRSLNP
jgi:hypothetical protein